MRHLTQMLLWLSDPIFRGSHILSGVLKPPTEALAMCRLFRGTERSTRDALNARNQPLWRRSSEPDGDYMLCYR